MNIEQLTTFFPVLFIIVLLWNLIAFGYIYYKRKKRGSIFPPVEESDIIFSEKTASGSSHKNIFTKYGGAGNCLKIIVTNDELWTTTWFPFTLIIDKIDLEHRIQKELITNIEKRTKLTKEGFIIHFKTENGTEKTVELYPKNNEAFAKVIGFK